MQRANQPTLKRSLNTPLLALYGLGVTVGAGIYVLIGATAAQAGSVAWLAFLIAACVVGFTALSYAELSTRYPVSAGEAVYVEEGFHRPRLATVIGSLVALSGMISAAAITVGASGYLSGLTGIENSLLIAPIVVLMGGLAWWGITQSVVAAAAVTVVEIFGLCFVIYWGAFMADPVLATAQDFLPVSNPISWSGLIGATVLAFFAFVGFEDMVNVAEEVQQPRKTLPRAILITLFVATVLYVATCMAVLWSVPLDALSKSKEPLALVFENAPPGVRTGFSSLAVIATVNGVLIQIIMSSRIVYGMAARGNLPDAFAKISDRTRTPGRATAFVCALILGLALFLPIDKLAGWTSQVVLIVFFSVNCALIAIKTQNKQSATDHFNVWLAVPLLGSLSSLGLLVLSLI